MYTISANNKIIILRDKHALVAHFIITQPFITSSANKPLNLAETIMAIFINPIGRITIDIGQLLKETEKQVSILSAFLDTCVGETWRTATFIYIEN